jgi:hypothetical protein
MAKTENKTKPAALAPSAFIAAIADGPRKSDAETLLSWFGDVTGRAGARRR